MLILILLSLFNAVAHQLQVVNVLRLPIPGFPMGVPEIGAVLLLIHALVFGGTTPYPSKRMHPALVTTLVLLGIGLAIGSAESFLQQISLETFFRWMRELGAWPLYLFVGYRLIKTPRSATTFLYLLIICGFLTATVLLANWSSNAEKIELSETYNAVRTVWYVDNYAGLASMLLAYTLVTDQRLLPKIVALPLACYCLAGQCSPLHRVEWLGMTLCAVGLMTLIPPNRRVVSAVKGLVVVVVLGGAMFGALWIASNVTHRDFFKYASDRIVSMLPTARETSKEGKAWDTRLDSLTEETKIWLSSPVFGKGLGIQDELAFTGKIVNYGAFHHNGWMAILAQMGPIGLAGYMMIIGGGFVIGRRLVREGPTKSMRLIGFLAFMVSIYGFTEVLGAGEWAQRIAILHGVIVGMAYRCYDMREAVAIDQELTQAVPAEEYAEEPLPEHVPSVF